MIFQPGVLYPGDLRVILQERGHRHRVVAVALHAQRQRFQPLQDHEGVERRQRRAHVAQRHNAAATNEGGRAEGLGIDHAVIGRVGGIEQRETFRVLGPRETATIDNDAAQSGTVTTHVFGQRVDHDVRAVLKRAAQCRCGHGVIDDQRDAVAVSRVGQRLNVDDVTGRVADGFAEHRLGARVDQAFQCGDVVVGGKAGLDALTRQSVGKQVVGAAIQLGHRHDIVAGFGQRLDRIGNRGHTGGHRQRTHAALERGNPLLQHIVGRVHDAAVDVARHLQVEQVGTVLGVVKGVRGGLIDRHGHRVGVRVWGIAGVNGERFKLHCAVLVIELFKPSAEHAEGSPDGQSGQT